MTGQPEAAAEIAVVIVNYATAKLTIDAVQSVLGHDHGGREVEVHLVDNASPGDDMAVLEKAHLERGWGDRVVLYPESENLGFGCGNNVVLKALALRAQPPEKVFFLNPDAQLDNEAIDILAGVLDSHPHTAVVGASLLRQGTGNAVSGAFRFPTPMSEFADTADFGPITGLFRRWSVALGPDHPPDSVDWVSGAAFMGRFTSLSEIGYFDPAFFLYFEEIDLMHRLKSQGWDIRFEPSARVLHVSGAATGVRGRKRALPAYWFDSWRIYFCRRHGRVGALFCALARLTGWAVNSVVWTILNRDRRISTRFGRDFLHYAVGPILTGQPHGPKT